MAWTQCVVYTINSADSMSRKVRIVAIAIMTILHRRVEPAAFGVQFVEHASKRTTACCTIPDYVEK